MRTGQLLLGGLLAVSIAANVVLLLRHEADGGERSVEVATPPADAGPPATEDASNPAPELDSALSAYAAVGSSFANDNHLMKIGWSREQLSAFLAGVQAAYDGEPYPLTDAARGVFAAMAARVRQIETSADGPVRVQEEALEKFMEEVCARFRLRRADSGLAFGVTGGGRGIRPSPEDEVVISMAATTDDAQTEIAQLAAKNLRVRVGALMPGLAEGVQLMTIESKAMFIVPPSLSFGDGAWPAGVAPGKPLIFVVDLHQIISPDVGS